MCGTYLLFRVCCLGKMPQTELRVIFICACVHACMCVCVCVFVYMLCQQNKRERLSHYFKNIRNGHIKNVILGQSNLSVPNSLHSTSTKHVSVSYPVLPCLTVSICFLSSLLFARFSLLCVSYLCGAPRTLQQQYITRSYTLKTLRTGHI